MQYSQVLESSRLHVVDLFETRADDRLIYHNLQHTEHVVKHAMTLLEHYDLPDDDRFVVLISCWFHDVGYLFQREAHESVSADRAAEFLSKHQVSDVIISKIKGCIMATVMPQQPGGLTERIVCDADLFHFGSEQFKERNRLMRKEAEAFSHKKIDRNEWRIATIKLLETHQYHTEFCQKLLNGIKAKNLSDLKLKHSMAETSNAGLREPERLSVSADKRKNDRPDRGIETMFRISSANHQRLSDMADNKAHIMISTTSIILSVILSVLLRRLEDNPHLIIPTLIMLIICVVTMVFAILATRPTIPTGVFTPEDIKEKRVNLLFFGNFYRMSLSDYQDGMIELMNDREFLYGSLIKDVYAQGVVLGRKYRFLRVAYNVFMFGIIAAVLSFIIAAYLAAF